MNKEIKSVKEFVIPNEREYVVQYEIEFDDDLSINDVIIIKANSEFDAVCRFDNDKKLQESILANYSNPVAMNVSANACWPAEDI